MGRLFKRLGFPVRHGANSSRKFCFLKDKRREEICLQASFLVERGFSYCEKILKKSLLRNNLNGGIEMTTNFNQYEPLTTKTAIQLVYRLGLLEEKNSLTCEEVGDGNLNLVFKVIDQKSHKSVIVKQALPYAKVVGESWPLTLDRATIESNALLQYADIAGEYVPKVYYSDRKLAITIMEDLSHLDVLRKGLMEEKEYPLLSKHIGEFVAKTLFFTSDFALSPSKKKELAKQYYNPELCKITEDLVFTDPFFDHETNQYEKELQIDVELLWRDQQLKLEVAKLKKKFITNQDALIHGDLHTGSIFVNEKETKIIDPEFAFYGPLGFDIGQFIANLLLNALSRRDENRETLFEHIEKTWSTFSKTFSFLWNEHNVEAFANVDGYLEHVLQKTLEDAIGFAGCEMIRRTIGLAHVADLDEIKPYESRIIAKQNALQLGANLIKNKRNILSISEIKNIFYNLVRTKETLA